MAVMDNRTLVIGAPRDDEERFDAGGVFQYELDSYNFMRRPPLLTAELEENCGTAVAAVGFVFAVGCPFYDQGAQNAGRIMIFDGATGLRRRIISNPTPGADDYFGLTMAPFGENLLVGARKDDTLGANAGIVYLVDPATGSVIRAYNKPSPQPNDHCGTAVAAFEGNILMTCNPGEFGFEPGAVYLLDAGTGSVLQTYASPHADDFQFGFALAAIGDEVLIGASGAYQNGTSTGAAYLFDAPTGALKRTFLNPTPESVDQFGSQVALDGRHVLVSAPEDDWHILNNGAVYVFDADNGVMIRALSRRQPSGGLRIGTSLAVVDDRVLAGATGHDFAPGEFRVGAVYAFEGAGDLRGIAYTNFAEPPANAADYEPPPGADELGFQTSATATTHHPPLAKVTQLPGIDGSAPYFAHRYASAVTQIDSIPLDGHLQESLYLDIRLGNTEYEAEDFLRVTATNGVDTIVLFDHRGGTPEGLNDLADDGWIEYSTNIPTGWQSVWVVMTSYSDSPNGDEFFILDSIRVVGVPIPEPTGRLTAVAAVFGAWYAGRRIFSRAVLRTAIAQGPMVQA
jgi:outer membrane protein assembly factor BamB